MTKRLFVDLLDSLEMKMLEIFLLDSWSNLSKLVNPSRNPNSRFKLIFERLTALIGDDFPCKF